MSRLRIAVVGVGHLGKEHARILSSMSDVELVGVVDSNAEQASAIAFRHGTQAFTDFRAVVPLVDAAVLVVPTTYHHALACEFLRHGIHLLVEKPLAANLQQAEELVTLAREHSAVLQVGHIERFNPAFEELLSRPLQPKFVTCERIGPFSGRSTDIGVVLDLMIHDLDLLLALVKSPVRSVEAVGVAVLGGHEDIANARIVFENGCVANVSASRVSPRPSRMMYVWGPEGFASLDLAKRQISLIQPSELLRQPGFDVRKLPPASALTLKDEMFSRHLQLLALDRSGGDQLTRELADFIHCVRTGDRPRVTGEDGREVIALATRILDSLRSHSWTGAADSPKGPSHLPAPCGQLFEPPEQRAAA
jgi:predicted dehydrogenase